MTSPVKPDAHEMNISSANSKPVVKPTAVVSAPEKEQPSKRGRKPGQVAKPKAMNEPVVRFFGGEFEGGIPKITREYENETEARIDSYDTKKKYFAVTVWEGVRETIGTEVKIVQRPVNSEQQSA